MSTLAHGGLAVIGCAFLIAAFVAVPLATIEWHAGRPAHDAPQLTRTAAACSDLWSLLVLAALAAPVVHTLGWRGAAAAAFAWLIGALVAWRGKLRVAAIIGTLAWLTIAGDAIWSFSIVQPWTLLGPQWHTWFDWAPVSVSLAILLTGIGLGHWASAPKPITGRRRLPWTAMGIGLVAVLATAVVRAYHWIDEPAVLEAGMLITIAAIAAVGGVVLTRVTEGPHPVLHPLIGLFATLWFAGPAYRSLELWWLSLLPIAPALAALVIARTSPGAERWLGWLGVAVFGGSAIAGWPGIPPAPLDAAAAAMIPVAAVWYVGTRVSISSGSR